MPISLLPLRFLSVFFFFNDSASTEIYTLSLHDALPILRQLELPQDRFGVRGELLVRLVGPRRMHDLHQLDLVELVIADHAAGILAGGSRFRTEARRMAGVPERQTLERQDLVAHEIGD